MIKLQIKLIINNNKTFTMRNKCKWSNNYRNNNKCSYYNNSKWWIYKINFKILLLINNDQFHIIFISFYNKKLTKNNYCYIYKLFKNIFINGTFNISSKLFY